ncbi:MAG TPA: NINE protein [Acidimicrobiales bacterium]
MSDTSQGEGWWLASDGKWYAPVAEAPAAEAPAAPPAPAAPAPPAAPAAPVGAPMAVSGEVMSDKSKTTAGLLGILLGGFGVHNFYLGFTNKAILQIVVTVFTCGLGALWGIFEGIMILTGNEAYQHDSDGRRLTE